MTTKLAQIDFNALQNANGGTFQPTSIGDLISRLLPYLFTIAGLVLLLYLIFGGLQLMLSGGDPKGAASAKAHITNALIGFVIIFIAFWAVQIFGAVLGLKGITAIFR
ncbi:MAG TPA: hypothetical protein VF185_02080 [Patescibacteria group bacterium]